ncbi:MULTISPECIES: LPS export ABC transporter periplasmic protein LptC [Pseudovibrio]|uniref:LPS export ABC transporter periplasmic protein LptC n=1 Tax=Stappiaceae TaxID=2821832 RepID=UPI002366AFB6|nr:MULTISPECIES: LPS export ABC transporter periplasmic protein LptC [Pseudovibrio]MDD7909812.1 LPS export ABC transporter periplasmic protein LptC [Pseudovibrio exalbescens]MDX5592152.1 LPS export ABC transporter periplasmic protein LptC [Pseudovibrio sp. SPO723]
MQPAPQAPRGFVWSDEAKKKQEAARRAAKRHTRLVKFLRFTLPALGTLIAAGIIGAVILRNILAGMGLGDISLTVDGLVMSNPHLTGSDGERSYSVSADKAIQRISNPKIIDLETLRAKIVLGKDENAEVVATKGTYNADVETLKLREGITVTYSGGYTGEFDYLDIDMTTGMIVTNSSVTVQAEGGYIHAGSMDYDQNGGVMRFSDGVSLRINPSSLENSQ